MILPERERERERKREREMMMPDRGGREGKMMVVEKEGDARKRER